jgi:hypothetical protein
MKDKTIKELEKTIDDLVKRKDKKALDQLSKDLEKILNSLNNGGKQVMKEVLEEFKS